MRSFGLTLAFAVACSAPPHPRSSDLAGIDAIADGVIRDGGVLGVAVVVLRGDEPVIARGYGFVDAERRVPMTEQSVVATASLTKQYWAAAIMQLVEAGTVELDRPVQDVLPVFPDRRVTVRQLLSHTAGLGDDADGEDDLELRDLPPLSFTPGQSWAYSNRGSLIARRIVEQVSGLTWADYLRDRIAAPLGLAHTVECPPTGGRVPGWRVDDAGVAQPATLGAESMARIHFVCADAVDLARWTRSFDTHRLLRAGSVAAMRAPVRIPAGATTVPLGYGLFTRIGAIDGHRAYGHTGNLPGVSVAAFALPDDDLTIVVVENSTPRPGHAAASVVTRIARQLLGTTAPREQSPTAELLAACAGDYVAPGLRLRFTVKAGALWAAIVEPAEAQWSGRLVYVGGSEFLGSPDGIDPDSPGTFVIVDGRAELVTWGHRLMLEGIATRADPAH